MVMVMVMVRATVRITVLARYMSWICASALWRNRNSNSRPRYKKEGGKGEIVAFPFLVFWFLVSLVSPSCSVISELSLPLH